MYQVLQALKKLKQDKLFEINFKEEKQSDLYSAILKDQLDLLVLSSKELELKKDDDLDSITVLGRLDPREILLFKKDSFKKPSHTINFLSNSKRREINFKNFFENFAPISIRTKKIQFQSIVGSFQEKMNLFLSDGIDALLVSKASLDRLSLLNYPGSDEPEIKESRDKLKQILDTSLFMVLPLSMVPSAPGQGGITVVFKKGRDDLKTLLQKISYYNIHEEIEREILEISTFPESSRSLIGLNCLKRSYGFVLFARGKDGNSDVVLQRLTTSHQPKSNSHEYLYPNKPELQNIIRTPLENLSKPPGGNLFVTRISSWHKTWKHSDISGLVWTSGLQVFKELTDEDIWVHGCSDSLGEGEDPDLNILFNETEFIKLSHVDSEGVKSRYRKFYSYKIEFKDFPDLRNRTHFYWTSAFQFDTAIEKYPMIANQYHACAPGITRNYIQKKLGRPVDTFLSYESWLEYHTT